jgi:hypothetical protein
MGHALKDLEPYILQLFLGTIALFGLFKDWKDYKEKIHGFKSLPWVLLVITVAVIGMTLFETHNTRRETREKEQAAATKDAENAGQITVLTEQVRMEREENKHNSDGFRQSFDSLYRRYSDLASKVQNADLLREIKETRSDLKTTQEKLTQPKPRLIASFWKANMERPDFKKEIDVVKAKDGSVSFEIVTLNESEVAALKGETNIRICALCKYAKEPEGSRQLPGAPDTDRALDFDHMFSSAMTQKLTLEVTPPSFAQRFTVDVHYACENCTSDTQTLKINIVPMLHFPR